MGVYTIVLITVIALFVIAVIIYGLKTLFSESKMNEEEYIERKNKARGMMTMIDPLTGLPYSSMDKPSHVEYRDERFSIKNDDESGHGSSEE